MQKWLFPLFSSGAVLFSLTSLYRSNFLVRPEGYAIYFTIKILLFALLLVCGFQMRGTKKTSSERPIKAVERPSLDPLLSLRAAACFMVVFGHLFLVVFPPMTIRPMLAQKSPIFLLTSTPWGGVWVFFTLSGYLIGKGFFHRRYSFDNASLHRYLVNRLLRIAPVYYAAILILSLLVNPEIFLPGNLWMLLLIFIFDYPGNFAINPDGALWSVTTEMQFYLLAPLLFLFLAMVVERAGKLTLLFPLLVCAIGIATKEYFGRQINAYDFIYTPTLSNLDLFLIGMAANPIVLWFRKAGWTRFMFIPVGWFIFSLLYVGLSYATSQVAYDAEKLTRFWLYAPGLTALVSALVIVIFETAPRVSPTGFMALLTRGTQMLGTLTYCIYTWQAPILLSIRRTAPAQLSWPQTFCYSGESLLFVLIMATIFFYAIELPFDTKRFANEKPIRR